MNDDEKYIEEFVKDIPFEDERAEHRDTLRAQLLSAFPRHRLRPRTLRVPMWRTIMRTPITKLAAAVLMLALAVLAGQLVTMLSDGSVAWADVAARFQTVPFFNATIYIKDGGATAEPKQMELWWNWQRQMRLRYGTQVIFAAEGQDVRAYDVETRQQVEPNVQVAGLLARLSQAEEFTLDKVIEVMFDGTVEDVTPLVNPDAVISQDLVVFDIDMPGMSEWVRIWALRESRLPMRIREWNSRNGSATDVFFEYSKGQDAEFFDADAFGALLESNPDNTKTNIAYAFLVDPGGREVIPSYVVEETDYHLPDVEQVGITPDGAVWVISSNARNKMPDGRPFYGFTGLGDDLGRHYTSVYGLHQTASDRSIQVFVPVDYPFDGRTLGKLTLICREPDLRAEGPQQLVGTVELTEWANDTLWPEGTVGDEEWAFRLRRASDLCRGRDFEKVERLLATVEGELGESPAALERERIRLKLLVAQQKCSEAVVLAERLMPLLEADYTRWKGHAPDASLFSDIIEALICTDEFGQAKLTWEHIKTLHLDLPATVDTRLREELEETRQAYLDDCLQSLVYKLAYSYRITALQIESIFGPAKSQSRDCRLLIEQVRRRDVTEVLTP